MVYKEREDPFWYDNIEILYRKERLVEFVPLKNMSLSEKLNSLVRFCFYLGVLLFFYYDNFQYMYIPVFGLLFTYFIYNRDSIVDENSEKFKDDKRPCRRPTIDNPFMNPNLVTERNLDYQPCRIYDEKELEEDQKLKQEVDNAFNHNLYKDIDDPYDKVNSQRQFFTVPATTIPNDQMAFAKWLYTDNKVCKSGDQDACLRYEDVRFQASPILVNPNIKPQ
jgi:hypothetical protein